MAYPKVLMKKLENYPEAFPLPQYESAGAAGMDLRAAEATLISPASTRVVKTGLAVAVPEGFEMQVRSRSGLAAKHAVFVTNGPGTIDADYRGEIMVILTNLGDTSLIVSVGDRVAQAVICPVMHANVVEADELPSSVRGAAGLGSTGRS